MRSYTRSWQESVYGVIDTLKSDNGVDQLIVPCDISLAWFQGSNGVLSVGADYQGTTYSTWSDPLTGYRIYGNKSTASQIGIYAQEEWKFFKKLSLRAGIRYTYVGMNVSLVNSSTPVKTSPSWQRVLWSAGFRYNISRVFSAYINAGSSFAPPGLKSTSGTILASDYLVPGKNGQLPNPGLKPEKGMGFDAGLECQFKPKVNVGFRLFYIIMQDAIIDNVVSRNPSQSQSINTESYSTGGEIEISHTVCKWLSWYANGTYMFTNIKNDSNPDQNNVAIPFSPNWIVNIGFDCHTSFGLSVVPSFSYNGGFYDATSKTDRLWFTPGVLFNLFASQSLTRKEHYVVDLFAQAYNITNNRYIMPWQFQNPGFSIMAGLKVTLR